MFGMNDPTQTLLQLERYVAEGRLEMSEVMATQFTEMFLAQKKRTADAQIMLVKGLRILCDVFSSRNKIKRAVASVKILHRERKKLIRMLKTGAPQLLEKMTPPAEDYRRAGKIYAKAGTPQTKPFTSLTGRKRGGTKTDQLLATRTNVNATERTRTRDRKRRETESTFRSEHSHSVFARRQCKLAKHNV